MSHEKPTRPDASLMPSGRLPVEVSSNHGAPKAATARKCNYVVGIGASAGGLRPLEHLFRHMPTTSGVAFVVVQHLSPDFKSLMHELLSRQTEMPVHRAENGATLEPDSIYLIPPRKNMTIRDGRLHLEDQDNSPGHPLKFPIDLFFESLAKEYRERSIAVVLSGTGSDGTRGVRDIAEIGGLVLVQDPETSEFDGMPRSAIATNLAHFIESPDQIARTIYGYVKQADAVAYAEPPTPQELLDVGRIAEVTALLRTDDGVDFTHYKPTTLARRISRRMLVAGSPNISDYLQKLSMNIDERTALRDDLLIGVTSFFRDQPVWDHLREHIIDGLIQRCDGSLRVWVTACSTGQEVYSLAMLLHNAIERLDEKINMKIFATDIDRKALETASAGRYDIGAAQEIGDDLVGKFFHRRGHELVVRRELRESIIFSPHNLLRDAPFTKLDLVTCRNVLIYMQPELQDRVIATLHFGLRHRGVMLLGAAETPNNLSDEFEEIDKKLKIFAKARDVTLPIERRRPLSGQNVQQAAKRPERSVVRSVDGVLNAGFRLVLERVGGLCLVLDSDLQILHVFGESNRYLSVPQGIGTTDAAEMLPDDLVLPLRTAAHRSRTDGAPSSLKNLRIPRPEGNETVDMQVSYMPAQRGVGDFFLVMVTPVEPASELTDPSGTFDLDSAAADRIQTLERELQHTRENLQATIEELETTNEEQQASNEELLASNEELQSTNEELHSVNEELYTVNAEYQQKINELTQLNDDMDNLLASTEIGTIFLDTDLRIRKFTPAATDLIRLMDHDIGRRIHDFNPAIPETDIVDAAERVLKDQSSVEIEVRTDAGRPLLMRAQPYISGESACDGVVLTFVNISVIKEAQEDLARQKQRFQELVESITEVFWVVGGDTGEVEYISPMFEDVWGFPADDLYNDNNLWIEAIHKEDRDRVLRSFQAFLGGGTYDTEYRIITPKGQEKWIHARGWPVIDDAGEVVRRVGVAADITDIRGFREGLKKLVDERTGELERAHSALEKAQTELRDLYDYAPDMMLSVDAEDGRIVECNQTLCEKLGWARDELLGMSVIELYDESCLDAAKKAFEQFRSTGEVTDARLMLVTKAGKQIDVSLNVSAVRDERGRVIRSRSVWRDITELCAIEADLRRHQNELGQLVEERTAQLERKHKEMEEFVYTISHDLKSPLVTISGIAGYLRRLVNDGETDQLDELTLSVEESALRMRERIDYLLELSRLGRVIGQLEHVDLREVVIEVVQEHRQTLDSKRIHCQVATGLPCVLADRYQMERVFDNLISNALTYGATATQEQPRIEILSENVGGRHRICVRDNGPGIDVAHHERVFGLFSRVAADSAGAGVGLALVKRVMNLYGGRVWVDSTPGHGAAFWLEFPSEQQPAKGLAEAGRSTLTC